MSNNYASVADMTAMWRSMTVAESERAAALIPIVSAQMRVEARKVGRDLDVMITRDPDLEYIAKSVCVDTVARCLQSSTTDEPMTQMSQSALGYSVSGTYLNAGGGVTILNRDLKRLGLKRQRYGVIDFYGDDSGSNDTNCG